MSIVINFLAGKGLIYKLCIEQLRPVLCNECRSGWGTAQTAVGMTVICAAYIKCQLQISRGATIHRKLGASRYSQFGSVHDTVSMIFSSIRFHINPLFFPNSAI